MPDNIETEIRKALDAKAHQIEVPETLAERTLEMAKSEAKLGLRDRLRARRDARRTRLPASGYPRWMYAVGAGATAVLLFVVGAFVTLPAKLDVQATTGGAVKTLEAPAGAESVPGVDSSATRSKSGSANSGDATTDRGGVVVNSAPGAAVSGGTFDSAQVSRDQIAPVPPVPGPTTGKLPPKIVRNADIQVEVKTFAPAWGRANAIASHYGGFVTNSSTEQIKDKLGRGTLTMRIPAEKIDAALSDLRKLGTPVQENTSGNDISAPIADVKARLKVLGTEELQLLDLLRRSSNVSETLEVRSRLDEVRQETESLKAQRDVYENEVDFATINATVFEKGIDPNDGGGGDGIIMDAMRTALRIGLTIVAGTVVVLGGLVPLAALGLVIWLIFRAVRRRKTA